MPPTYVNVHPLRSIPGASFGTSAEDENIWTQILSEVSKKCANNMVQGAVVIMGDKGCGKSWLLSRLEKRDTSGRGTALEYHFLNVHTDYRDASYAYQLSTAGAGVAPGESVTLPVWVHDGEVAFSPLSKFALNTSLSRNVVVLCASLDHPSTILSSLDKWADQINEQIQRIFDKETVAEARQAQVLFWQEYVEPLDSSMHSDKIPSMEAEQVLLPLHHNVLTQNTGMAMVVVLTKCDLAHSELSDEQLDRVQFHVRKFCMQYGAALVYTSAKEEKNTALLYKYLVHRACGIPFTTPAHLVEKDAIFIPAGWDNEKKLDILRETIQDAEMPLEIIRERHHVKEQVVEAEEEQSFLQKLANVELSSPKRVPPQKVVNEAGDAANGNSPLVSFFNNLLKTKDGQGLPVSRSVPDPQAHLQRMLEQANNAASNAQPNISNILNMGGVDNNTSDA